MGLLLVLHETYQHCHQQLLYVLLELLTNLTQQNFVICYIYCVHRNNFKGYFSQKRVPVSLSIMISSNSTFGAIKPILKQQQYSLNLKTINPQNQVFAHAFVRFVSTIFQTALKIAAKTL